jgi:hypothetical protein
MEISVRERRAIVEHETLPARGVLTLDRTVESRFLPMCNASWFTLRKPRAHGEVRFRELQSVFQIVRHAKEKWARVGGMGSESRGEVASDGRDYIPDLVSRMWRIKVYLRGDGALGSFGKLTSSPHSGSHRFARVASCSPAAMQAGTEIPSRA